MSIRLLALSGSLRAASTNTRLLRALAEYAPFEVDVSLYRGMGSLPIFNPDLEGRHTPQAVIDLAEKVQKADGLVISCPEYAHGIPGGLKNALDWLVSREEIIFKPVLVVHASHRGDNVLAALGEVLKTISADVMAGEMLRVPLLGRNPAEIEAVLEEPAIIAAMERALSAFADYIRSRS